MLVLAGNQRGIAETLQQAGVASVADMADLPVSLASLLAETLALRAEQSRRAAALCDGRGALRAATRADFAPAVLRPAAPVDCRCLFEWRNHPEIRRFMSDSGELLMGTAAWFARQLANPEFTMLLYEAGGTAQGYASQTPGRRPLRMGLLPCARIIARQGHGGTLGQLVLQYAFCRLNMHEVHGQALPHNAASPACTAGSVSARPIRQPGRRRSRPCHCASCRRFPVLNVKTAASP